MIAENHYKFQKGELTLEQVVRAMDGIDMIDSVRRGIIDYFVNGRTIKETKVNSGMLIPYLRQVNINYINSNMYLKRFLYTNDFSPRKRMDTDTYI